MRLGLLDFCSLRAGQAPTERIFESIELAREAEGLGFSRYWLAEHHELSSAHHAPELLAALIAGSTEHIRVGVAGMLMLMHSPMRVAKAFRLLAGVFPGRVDLGVGGALTGDPAVVEAMREGWRQVTDQAEDYARRVRALVELVRGDSPQVFNPVDAASPPVWLLGAGGSQPAELAGRGGTCYGVSLCHKRSRDDPGLVSRYLDTFTPSRHLDRPQWVVAVAGVCAETAEEAQRLAGSSPRLFPEGLEVVGTPASCGERLQEIGHRYQTEELVFLDLSPGLEERRRSYQLLAEQLRLHPPGAARSTG